MTESETMRKREVLRRLSHMYPQAGPGLHFSNPYETLVATMLSAQSTDKQVNKVTPAVFRDFPSLEAMAATSPDLLTPYVKSCGFASKPRNIVMACRQILSNFDGKVPNTLEGLMSLPGVGRKTANVVLANAYGIPALAVDTHVFRVSNRLGLAESTTVLGTEQDLTALIPRKDWIAAHHQLILHGRLVCRARSPLCSSCELWSLCPWPQRGEGPSNGT